MFRLNGIVWYVCFVDPSDLILYDVHNNIMSVATTDWNTRTIYISNDVDDDFLLKIIKHELYHCYEFSIIAYDLPLYYEECVADFMATHGEELIDLAYELFAELTYY